MIRSILVLALATSVACGSSKSGAETAADSSATVDRAAPARRESLPPMPAFPSARRGHLIARAAGGRDTVGGSWRARAVRCSRPAAVQLAAGDSGAVTLVLFHLAPDEDPVGEYPMAVTDSGHPPAPAAQMGVLASTSQGVRAFQAVDGTAALEELREVASGRFAVTLREIDTNDSVRYVGVFLGAPVEPASATDCTAAPDSLVAPDTLARSPR